MTARFDTAPALQRLKKDRLRLDGPDKWKIACLWIKKLSISKQFFNQNIYFLIKAWGVFINPGSDSGSDLMLIFAVFGSETLLQGVS